MVGPFLVSRHSSHWDPWPLASSVGPAAPVLQVTRGGDRGTISLRGTGLQGSCRYREDAAKIDRHRDENEYGERCRRLRHYGEVVGPSRDCYGIQELKRSAGVQNPRRGTNLQEG